MLRVQNYLWLALSLASLSANSSADEPKVYREQPEVMAVRPRSVGESNDAPIQPKAILTAPATSWIWGADDNQKYVLRKTFRGKSRKAQLQVACDNEMSVYLNGERVAAGSAWNEPSIVDVSRSLKDSENVLEAVVTNAGGPAGFVCQLMMNDGKNDVRHILSDNTWQVLASRTATESTPARVVASYGEKPWGTVFANEPGASSTNSEFQAPEGFRVERLFSVPKEELGSWVCLTTDDKGRLIASDERDKGLYRITPAPLGTNEPTKVEKLSLNISSCHGMLHAFGALYLTVNGGPGSGLYRARDTNNDDQYDELTKLFEIRGTGEHGPHALRLSPDGQSIYLVAGNYTKPPFERELNAEVQTMGGIRPQPLRAKWPEGASSRQPPIWDEDLILPRQWDANGHAVGLVSPGGWVAKTDPEGKTWELISTGYRNSYDMAFNADGELFVYDSDMEWDMGSPWYRPTRVLHATSGSEFGWRSGTGCWPAYFADSLGGVVDIGPGSPVGVEFGYGAKFPAKYQQALFICDWTFGTMYALHLEPQGSTYTAKKEEFLSRTPLPLTDCVIGRDGAMYVTVGGRGTQSELYRVTYTGTESTAPASAKQTAGAELRTLRQKIEAYHRPGHDPQVAVPFLMQYLGFNDKAIRFAARIGLEHLPAASWQDRVLAETNPEALLTGVMGLARHAEPTLLPKILQSLGRLDAKSLSDERLLALLRAYEVTIVRLGLPTAEAATAIGTQFDTLFTTTKNDAIRREIANLCAALGSPKAVVQLAQELTKERQVQQDDWTRDLLARNAGYGGSIAKMFSNQPDRQQLHYALVLRNVKAGWTMADRKAFFGWFEKAREWSGGASYQKFLVNIEKDAYELLTDAERVLVEAQGARKPYKAPELPKPVGPGKDYSLDELIGLNGDGLKNRNFKNGEKMFSAARCVVCHRFAGEGGATGPDLSNVAGRFQFKDLAEAIVDPSKVVSDQYKTTQLVTTAGKSYVGRVVSATDDSITLLVDPEDSTKLVTVKKTEIEEQQLSATSLMPKDLLKTLNPDEVLDLMAYMLSRGSENHGMFKKK